MGGIKKISGHPWNYNVWGPYDDPAFNNNFSWFEHGHHTKTRSNISGTS